MDSALVYQRFAQLLTNDVPVSIELIPSASEEEQSSGSSTINPHHPFLLVDSNLGIPQSVLYKAYLIASKQIPRFPIPRHRSGQEMNNGNAGLVAATAILLVANPAHNTAINRRKQLIQSHSPQLNPYDDLKFTAALLGMKQASKSSLLWHHRRWLLRCIYGPLSPRVDLAQPEEADSLKDISIPPDVIVAEFELAARASETYPRNYHAWLHRYICVQSLVSLVAKGILGARDALYLELKASQQWVELHVADHTAVHYLSRLVSTLQDANMQAPFPAPGSSCAVATSFTVADDHPMASHAFSLLSFYPTHESLWLYLRLACATSRGQTQILISWIIDVTLSFAEGDCRGGADHARVIPTKAVVQKILKQVRAEVVPTVQKHAVRLLVWTLLSNGRLHPNDTLVQHLLVGSETLTTVHLRELSVA